MVLYVPSVQNTKLDNRLFAIVVGGHVAAVAFYAENRTLVFAACGVRQAEVLVCLSSTFCHGTT